MPNPMEGNMGSKDLPILERLKQVRAHQAEFVARNPDFLANEDAELKKATDAAQPITETASKRLSKKKPREFTTFIEKSQTDP
ncbi:MAG: hypothetical protein Q7R59_00685 [bacterium]|nr:hypothetical protein [bacterium]